MPTTKQLDSNRDTTNFSPVLGGRYDNSALDYRTTHGFWWGAEAYNGALRYHLYYYDNKLYTNNYYGGRNVGRYIRCVSEEKTVTDLTYLQDMTGEIASNTLDVTTANLPPMISSPTALAGKNAGGHLVLEKATVLGTRIIVSTVA